MLYERYALAAAEKYEQDLLFFKSRGAELPGSWVAATTLEGAVIVRKLLWRVAASADVAGGLVAAAAPWCLDSDATV